MDASTIFMASLSLILIIIGYFKGEGIVLNGLTSGGKLLLEIIPRMIFAFAVAGLVQAMIPKEFISRWIGEESGLRGLFIASMLGAITPGGPMTHFPIIAGFYKTGAGVGPVASYITSWSILGVNRLIIWEIPMMSYKFALSRTIASILLPPIVGIATKFIFVRL